MSKQPKTAEPGATKLAAPLLDSRANAYVGALAREAQAAYVVIRVVKTGAVTEIEAAIAALEKEAAARKEFQAGFAAAHKLIVSDAKEQE